MRNQRLIRSNEAPWDSQGWLKAIPIEGRESSVLSPFILYTLDLELKEEGRVARSSLVPTPNSSLKGEAEGDVGP